MNVPIAPTVFLDLNNGLGTGKLCLEASVLATQGGKFVIQRRGGGFGSTLLGRECLKLATGTQATPGSELG